MFVFEIFVRYPVIQEVISYIVRFLPAALMVVVYMDAVKSWKLICLSIYYRGKGEGES